MSAWSKRHYKKFAIGSKILPIEDFAAKRLVDFPA